MYQKPSSPDFENYRDYDMSPSSERSRTPSPPYNSTLHGDYKPYDEGGYNKGDHYGINKPYTRGSQNHYSPPQKSSHNNWNNKSNNDIIEYWALVDCRTKCPRRNRHCENNRRFIKSCLREAIGPEYLYDKSNHTQFNWARHAGLCYYAMCLIREYGKPLGKQQISKHLTAVCPRSAICIHWYSFS